MIYQQNGGQYLLPPVPIPKTTPVQPARKHIPLPLKGLIEI
jgi:hypothetical protein